MKKNVALVTLVVCSAAIAGEQANGWTRFRGPNGSGISNATTIPVSWTEDDYNWKVKLPGVGHSSPVVRDDRIFVTCSHKQTARRIIACLSTDDGGLIWRKDYESKVYRHHKDNSFASASPVVDELGVYATWTTPDRVTLLALDHNGEQQWRRNLGKFRSRHGSGTSPIVFEDSVVLAIDQIESSSFVAVDRKTGETRWRLERPTKMASYSTPCVYRPDGGDPELIFTSSSFGMVSVDPDTGEVNWEKLKIFPARCAYSPVIAGDLIVGGCGIGGRGVKSVVVRPGGKQGDPQPEVAWEIKRPIPYVPTPLAKDGLLFVWCDNAVVYCFKAATGEQIWRKNVRGSFYGSPVWVDGRLYCISKKGDVVVLAASEEYEMLARNPLSELTYTTPAVADGRMYIRTYSQLISIGGK